MNECINFELDVSCHLTQHCIVSLLKDSSLAAFSIKIHQRRTHICLPCWAPICKLMRKCLLAAKSLKTLKSLYQIRCNGSVFEYSLNSWWSVYSLNTNNFLYLELLKIFVKLLFWILFSLQMQKPKWSLWYCRIWTKFNLLIIKWAMHMHSPAPVLYDPQIWWSKLLVSLIHFVF